jgi:hypothetical protein
MTERAAFKAALGLSLAGTLFAGYLSAVNLFSKSCAFGEACPLFLGYPACYFGFGIFAALLAVSAWGFISTRKDGLPMRALAALSALGTLFAGSFVVREVAGWLAAGSVSLYGLGLPTCVYGLVFYVAVLLVALRDLREEKKRKEGKSERSETNPETTKR